MRLPRMQCSASRRRVTLNQPERATLKNRHPNGLGVFLEFASSAEPSVSHLRPVERNSSVAPGDKLGGGAREGPTYESQNQEVGGKIPSQENNTT